MAETIATQDHRAGRRRRGRRSAAGGVAVMLLAVATFVAGSTASGAISGSATFGAAGGTWTVPSGVNTIEVTLEGAGGGNGSGSFGGSESQGGPGSLVMIRMSVTPGEAFVIGVGTPGGDGSGVDGVVGGHGSGYGTGGGGGAGVAASPFSSGAGGGGGAASYLQYTSGSGALVAVAGGGGGGGGGGFGGTGGAGGAGNADAPPPGGSMPGGGGTGTTDSADGGNGGNGGTPMGWPSGGGGGGGSGFSGGSGGGGGSLGGGGGGAGGRNFVELGFAQRLQPDASADNPGEQGMVRIAYSGAYVTTTTLAATPASSASGQNVTLRATVTAAGTAAIPAGTVQFSVGGTPLGSAKVLPADGVLEVQTTELAVGTNQVAAAFTPSDTDDYYDSSGTADVVVAKGDTAMTLSALVDSSAFGTSVTFTAHLSAIAPAAGAPDGTVQFFDGATALGAPVPVNVSGDAKFTTASLPVGDRPITAEYSGNGQFNGSTAGPMTHTVFLASSSVVLATAKSPTVVGENVTFTAQVGGIGLALIPQGDVRFVADGAILGTAAVDASGKATLAGTGLDVGDHQVTATYVGSDSFAGATSLPVTQRVHKGVVTIFVTPPAAPVSVGDLVTVNATIGVQSPAVGTPTGSVQFLIGGTPIGAPIPVSGGGASIKTDLLPVGTQQISARYSGDGNFDDAAAVPVDVAVAPRPSTVTISSSKNPSVTGQSVTLLALVSGTGAGAPTGAVRFSVDGVVVDTQNLDAGGLAKTTIEDLSIDDHEIVATYIGDGTFTGATSEPLIQTVKKGATTVVVSPPGGPSAPGDPVVLSASVAPVAPAVGVPGGSVQFSLGGEPLGDAVPVQGGVAVLTTQAIPAGSARITATYLGDEAFDTATSQRVIVSVEQRVVRVEVTTSIAKGTVGDPVRAAVRIAALAAGPAPTGTVQFLVNGETVGDPLDIGPDGSVSVPLDSLAKGASMVSARYSGDVAYQAAASDPATVELAAPVEPEAPVPTRGPLDGLVINNNVGRPDTAAPATWSPNEPASGGTTAKARASRLPATGSNVAGNVGGALALILLGGSVLVFTRRRRLGVD